jgi:monomeric isocitrate dehydrogenase
MSALEEYRKTFVEYTDIDGDEHEMVLKYKADAAIAELEAENEDLKRRSMEQEEGYQPWRASYFQQKQRAEHAEAELDRRADEEAKRLQDEAVERKRCTVERDRALDELAALNGQHERLDRLSGADTNDYVAMLRRAEQAEAELKTVLDEKWNAVEALAELAALNGLLVAAWRSLDEAGFRVPPYEEWEASLRARAEEGGEA